MPLEALEMTFESTLDRLGTIEWVIKENPAGGA